MRLALREVNEPAGARSNSRKHVCIEFLGGLLKFAARSLRGVEIAGGQHDFNVRRQEARARESIPRGADHATACGRCRTGVSLRETQQCEPGLRLEARATGLAIAQFRQLNSPRSR
jgi:hypothetical protein